MGCVGVFFVCFVLGFSGDFICLVVVVFVFHVYGFKLKPLKMPKKTPEQFLREKHSSFNLLLNE